MEDYIAAHVLKADLEEIDRDLREKGVVPRMMAIVLIKHAFTTIGTLVDLELTLRPQYESYPTVGEAFSKTKRELEFAKYLRNKAIGHIHSQLLPKAIEWRPELKYMLSRLGEDGTMFIVNLYVLETAIPSRDRFQRKENPRTDRPRREPGRNTGDARWRIPQRTGRKNLAGGGDWNRTGVRVGSY